MMTSGEVAGMFQAQQQMYMGQNAWANQIGISAGGLDSYGRMNASGNGFSYAPSGIGNANYGSGTRFAANTMSGMGAAATLGGIGVSTAAAMGAFGRVGGALFDPFSAFGLARSAGMGMAGSLGVAALPLAGAAMVGAGVQAFVHGGQQQAAINTTLGQNFNFMNSSSRTMMGFSRQDSQQIGDQIRQLAHIPELLTSVEELTKLMPKLRQTGMMQGVKDAAEFNRRFKEAVSTIKDMSKVLGTTMEEASEFFAQSRGAGFFGRSAQLRNTLNAQFTSGVTGMDMGDVMSMQRTGAGFATQVGARRALGAAAVTNMAQSIGLAQREGRITEGLLEDVTGMQGPEAIRAASEKYTQAMYNFSQRSPVGKLLMAGMAKFDDNGKVLGLDTDLVRQFQMGAIGVDELKARAGRLTHDQKISFTHRQAGTLAMDLAGKVGVGGVADIFSQLVGQKGTDADRLVMGRHTGLNESELDLAFDLRGSMGSGSGEFGQMAKFRMQEAALREKVSPDAIMKRLKTRLHNATTAGIEAAGAKIFTEIGKAYDEFIDDLVGRHVVSLSKEGAEKLAVAMASSGKQDLKSMFAASHSLSVGASGGGMTARDWALVPGMFMTGGMNAVAFGEGGLFGVAGRAAHSFRNTDSAAWLFRGASDTGRSDFSQSIRARELLGSTGGRDGALIAKALNNGLAGEGSQSLGRTMRLLQGNIHGFNEMDDQRKTEELMKSLKNEINSGMAMGSDSLGFDNMFSGGDFNTLEEFYSNYGGKEGVEKRLAKMDKLGGKASSIATAVREMMASGSSFNGNAVIGLIARGQGRYEGGVNQVDFSKLGVEGAVDFTNVRSAKIALSKAEDTLGDYLSSSSVAVLKNSAGARQALMRAKDDPEVRKALMRRGPAGVEALRKKGIYMSEGELEVAQSAFLELESHGGDAFEKGYAAIGAFQSARDATDSQVIKSAFSKASEGLDSGAASLGQGYGSRELSALAQSFRGFSETGDLDQVRKASSGYLDAVRNAAGNDKSRLIEAGGDYGALAARVLKDGKSAGRVRSGSDLAKVFGLGNIDDSALKEIIGDANLGDGLNSAELKGIQDRVFGYKSAGATAASGQGKSVTVEDRMLGTLQNLDKTMSLLTTVMANEMGNDSQKEEAKKRYSDAYKEGQSPS